MADVYFFVRDCVDILLNVHRSLMRYDSKPLRHFMDVNIAGSCELGSTT